MNSDSCPAPLNRGDDSSSREYAPLRCVPVHALAIDHAVPPRGHTTQGVVMQSSAVRATTGLEHLDRTRTALVIGCARPPQNLSVVGRHAGMDVSVVVLVDAFVHMVFTLLVSYGVSGTGTGASGGYGNTPTQQHRARAGDHQRGQQSELSGASRKGRVGSRFIMHLWNSVLSQRVAHLR